MGITSSTEQRGSNDQQRGRSSSTSSASSLPTANVNISSNNRQQQQQQQQQQPPQNKQSTTSIGKHTTSSSMPAGPKITDPQIYSQSYQPNTKQSYGQSSRYQPGTTPAALDFSVLMSPPSSPLANSMGIPNSQEAVPTVFTWSGGGKEVYIAGSFNNWKEKIPLSHSEKDFTLIYNLPPGVHQYKFIVDGKWVHSSEQPVAADTKGNLINFVEVKSKDLSSELSSFKMSSTPPGSYTKSIPAEEFQKLPPPSLPPHLRRALLNTQPSTEDPTLLPLPHHVMLNHLYSLPRKDKVTILGVTNRYKTKFVTTVLYKPVHESNEKDELDNLN
ncbi:hypothetical protein SAMD00019534_088760 [Acytostelium subglobosum LB1]|uniref:hypothetical protein n=1 Tax=Acytostelium subglobosum LB1 TaxID=1410327 RepID=UPI0006448BC9|nr:hypothetical protein SAMD00019534_088760 [Acytostelium subglobosum LB1]GAM25701.1 hypothetical protein SAMD00019534_088760 [Acytostelium subglobosum LB1]|eukprot:XP_012751219.1 hypothetical protein SAMD00019534_088760 [Acytostelium subglobosum LB1]